VQVRLARNG
jgi:hypothetical protein